MEQIIGTLIFSLIGVGLIIASSIGKSKEKIGKIQFILFLSLGIALTAIGLGFLITNLISNQ